jgi:PPOX class probable FMN-dependent enzyme
MLVPWRSPLACALEQNHDLPHARYVQLATVRLDGRPANRTVVFRGFWDDSNQLKFVTDARSRKVAEINHQPWAEVCWYFANTREQFRLAGKLTLVGHQEFSPLLQNARQRTWHELSDTARTQFTWSEPGTPRAENQEFNLSPPDLLTPLPDFCLLLLNPDQVDHLKLCGDPQNRTLYFYDGQSWCVQLVNP